MLERFWLTELRRREPHLLSGGQKQRTALAGVLAVPRRVLVLDEPTAMLDPAGRERGAGGGARAARRRPRRRLRDAGDGRGGRRRPRRRAGGGRGRVRGERAAACSATADLLRRLGLGLPAAGELALELAAAGAQLSPLPLTLDELLAALGETP